MDKSKGGLALNDQALWQTRYEAFTRLYKGRDDVIAARMGKDGEYVDLTGAGLTFDRFCEHVQMKNTYALYNLDDQGRVSFALFDVDVFPRDQGWEKLLLSMDEKRQETKRIMHTLYGMGLERRNLLVEFPTVGYHLLLFFAQPVPGTSVKRIMKRVLNEANVDKIPFYPKKIEGSRWGDRVQLPLRINLNTSRRSTFVRDLDAFDPEHYDAEPDWTILDEVQPVSPEWVQRWGS